MLVHVYMHPAIRHSFFHSRQKEKKNAWCNYFTSHLAHGLKSGLFPDWSHNKTVLASVSDWLCDGISDSWCNFKHEAWWPLKPFIWIANSDQLKAVILSTYNFFCSRFYWHPEHHLLKWRGFSHSSDAIWQECHLSIIIDSKSIRTSTVDLVVASISVALFILVLFRPFDHFSLKDSDVPWIFSSNFSFLDENWDISTCYSLAWKVN